MQNVDFQVQGERLVITIDLTQQLGVSASGKSLIIATTSGNVSVPGYEEIKLGLNCYRPQQADNGSRRTARY